MVKVRLRCFSFREGRVLCFFVGEASPLCFSEKTWPLCLSLSNEGMPYVSQFY